MLPDPSALANTWKWRLPVRRAYNDALIFGDAGGAAYVELTHRLLSAARACRGYLLDARRSLLARLATIELTDAAAIAATHDSGQLRLNGRRRELQAIDALETTSLTRRMSRARRPSSTRSAVRFSSAHAKGRPARSSSAAIVEQLLIEGKRARDSEAAAMNMRLVTWRDGRAANEAFVAGSPMP